MGFRGPRLGSCSGIALSVRLEKQGPARRARRLTNRAGSVAARTEVGSHPAVADRRPNHAQDTGRSLTGCCVLKSSSKRHKLPAIEERTRRCLRPSTGRGGAVASHRIVPRSVRDHVPIGPSSTAHGRLISVSDRTRAAQSSNEATAPVPGCSHRCAIAVPRLSGPDRPPTVAWCHLGDGVLVSAAFFCGVRGRLLALHPPKCSTSRTPPRCPATSMKPRHDTARRRETGNWALG